MPAPSRRRPSAPPPLVSPEFPAGKLWPVWSPPPLGFIEAVVLSPHVWGTALHYDPTINRYFPCPLGDNPCPGCHQHKQLARWVGYAHAMLLLNGRVGCLAVSSDAWLGCEKLRQRQGDMRGTVVKLMRPGRGKVGKVVATVTGQFEPGQIPAACDIRPNLCLKWGMASDWWEWFYGLDPAGVRCPGLAEDAPADPKKGGE